MIKYLSAPFAIGLLLSGCSILEQKTPLGGEWKSATSSATIRFDSGRVSGSDGCNRYGSAYSISGDTLVISDKMMSTMMACEEEGMKTADRFRQSLLATKHYRIDGKKLTLLGASGEVLGEFIAVKK